MISKTAHLGLSGVLRHEMRQRAAAGHRQHLYFCVADHYEPYWGGAGTAQARAIVAEWERRYREIASGHCDSAGRAPQHTYFYPEEEYDPAILDRLAALREAGLGDVEVHLHHDDDHAAALHDKLRGFTERLHRDHGLLRRSSDGELRYAFIHGNWALDNSHPDGRWCGVDNELQVLVDTGCRVDMTMPSAPHGTQTRTVNSIYLPAAKRALGSRTTAVAPCTLAPGDAAMNF
ncbi:MAG: hypothetical protein GKS06_04590 [Acidobacteria bacterium]|nr:hypothetical protein [Acidobacteriota bacterium]